MKKIIAILVLTLNYSLSACAGVDTSALQQTLQASHLPTESLGILVEQDNQEIFALNADREFVPASLTKILTGAAAFEILGADHKFKTVLLTDATPSHGVLHGSLYLKGGGDPSFSSRKLSSLINQLKSLNIRTIDGNIVIDNSRFDEPTFHEAEEVKNFISSWNGYPLFLSLVPTRQLKTLLAQNLRYESRIRTMTAPTKNRDYVIYRNMNQPDLWTGIQLQQLLQRQRIALRGKVINGVAPAGAHVVAEISTPLKALVSHMMKMSSNYYAEVLTKNLAAEGGRKPANIQTGIDQIELFLDHVGIARSEYSLRSAAGFSRQNHISPRSINSVLKHIRSSESKFSLFRSSLAVAGVDGTLRHRMRNTPARGRILAKTGYLEKTKDWDDVVGIAGYALRQDGQVLTFTFVYNGPASPSRVRAVFDLLCIELVRPPRTVTFASAGGYGMHLTM